MSISADFIIDPDNRIIRHNSGASVYTVNELYSFMQDYFDDITVMSISVPLSAQTPTEYSLISGWFIPEDTFKYLKSGAIKTVGWDTGSYADGISIIKLSSADYVNCNAGDVGQSVTNGSATGILLDYNNTLRKWWVRKVTGTLAGTISSLTGTGVITSATSGESLYANVYTLGSINAGSTNTLYIEQLNSELVNTQISQYWDAGHVDLLVKVKESNALIDSGLIRVYCREYGDLYSHYAIDLSAGGRNPVPLGTASDSNNQTAKGTVATWNDVTITFGSITRDLQNGNGLLPYTVEIDCGNRTSLLQVYERLKLVCSIASVFALNGNTGQFYRAAGSYAENVTAPFGSFAGGQFFGERGVYLKNVPVNDVNNYKLVDSTNATQLPPYLATGTFTLGANLMNDANAKVTMFFTTNPSGNYGTENAVIVNDALGIPISYKVLGRSSINWSISYDTNSQGGRTPGTPMAVTIVAIGTSTGKLITTSYTITRTAGQSILLAADFELNYAN